MPKNRSAKDAAVAPIGGHNRSGSIFRDRPTPNGGRIAVMDREVFSSATRAANTELRKVLESSNPPRPG